MTEEEEEEFMDFGNVDPPVGKELNALDKEYDESDMTQEEYQKRRRDIFMSTRGKPIVD